MAERQENGTDRSELARRLDRVEAWIQALRSDIERHVAQNEQFKKTFENHLAQLERLAQSLAEEPVKNEGNGEQGLI